MNITLTGNLGSGKSSVCKILAAQGYNIVSGGDLFRGVAKERGISVIELNELAKKDRSIDDMIDERSTRLGDELDNTVFDSRLAWNFVHESFKVFLLVDTDEAARRVFAGGNRETEEYDSISDAAEGLAERAKLEMERFKMLYNIDYYDMNNYDLVIESTNATPEQIAGEILRVFEIYKKEKYQDVKLELNLRNMYPMAPTGIIAPPYEAPLEDGLGLMCCVPVDLVSIEGYNFLAANQEKILSELAAGKIFGEVASFAKGEGKPSLTQEDYQAVEEVAEFRYRSYPSDDYTKHDYMMDMSK